MKKTIFLLIFCTFLTEIQAQVELDAYSAATIPKELLENANAVVRRYDLSFEVKNIGEAIEKEHRIITILNDRGKKHAEPSFGYYKLNMIDDIEASIYDASGKLIRKMKKKDIVDFKPFEEEINDTRVKIINFPHQPYPYTIEYTVTTINKDLLFYPRWFPQSDNRTSIQNATFDVTLPLNMPNLRYKAINGMDKPIENPTANGKRYFWSLSKIKAFQDEPFLPISTIDLPAVLTAPDAFEINGYKGNMNTWNELGKFQLALNEGRDKLPEGTISALRELVKDCKDDYCKVEKIYSYLQNSTRYFYIGLGIGGWQPIKAEDVDRRKYGDCKALSNYTISMLKAIGVNAHYALVYAGENRRTIYEDFPCNFSNHIITFIPMANDTLWLECTNQTESCGYNSRFTGNRQALVITPDGGKLIRTPTYDERVNIAKTEATIKLDSEGSAESEVHFTHSAIQQDELVSIAESSADEQKKFIYNLLHIDNVNIKDFRLKRIKQRIPRVEQDIKLVIQSLASKSGKRLFLPINVFSKWGNIPSSDSTRRFKVQAHEHGFTQQDSVTFQLPDGYKPETKPTPLSINSLFGSFEMSITEKSPTELVFYRKLILNNKILPKEKFPELVDFLKNVAKADKGKLILVKTSS
jgi:hypothetical protein